MSDEMFEVPGFRLREMTAEIRRLLVCAERAEAAIQRLKADLSVLAVVGRMYLAALDDDPENGYLSLPDAIAVTMVREAVDRAALDSTDPGGQLDAPAPTRAVIVSDDQYGRKIGEEAVDGPPFPTDFGSGQLRRAERRPTRGRSVAGLPADGEELK